MIKYLIIQDLIYRITINKIIRDPMNIKIINKCKIQIITRIKIIKEIVIRTIYLLQKTNFKIIPYLNRQVSIHQTLQPLWTHLQKKIIEIKIIIKIIILNKQIRIIDKMYLFN